MPDDQADQARRDPPAPEETRRVREAAALRANLARRKQQARARAADEPEDDAPCR